MLFHSLGAATENARSSYIFEFKCGTASKGAVVVHLEVIR